MALRKKFIEVEIPMLNEKVSVAGPVEKLKNKTIKIDLSRKLKGRGLDITFQILNRDSIFAIPKKMKLIKSYIIKMIRKNSSYVEDSFKADCKDIKVTIKPFLITRKKVSKAVCKNLRNTAKTFLIENLKEKNYIEICNEIFQGNLQKELLPKLKKIYPLSFCEIRVFETREIEKANLNRDKSPRETESKEEIGKATIKEKKEVEAKTKEEPKEKETKEEIAPEKTPTKKIIKKE